MARLCFITFDANETSRDRHVVNRNRSNHPLASTIYAAVDEDLDSKGCFFKPMHQYRLLLTFYRAEETRASLKRILGPVPILIAQPADRGWAFSLGESENRAKLARWMRRRFTSAEIKEATIKRRSA